MVELVIDNKISRTSVDDPLAPPCMTPDAMAGSKPYAAAPAHNEKLGFPGELVDDWKEKAIARLGYLAETNRAFKVYLDTCMKCGACTDKCHYYMGSGDPKNMPVARQDLLRAVYRRYFTFAGKHFPKLVGAVDLTREVLDDWYSYYHQCSQCRRCAVFCPIGIDTAEISMAARDIMDHIGMGQKYCNEIIGKVMDIGNNLGLNAKASKATMEDLEEDIEDETGVAVRIPVDEKGADILLITPSADFFAEPHIDGLIGYAKVFHEAGVSWTVSSYASEAANFGMFIGDQESMAVLCKRIQKAAIDLGVKRIIFGECGHAWRVAYNFLNTLGGPFDFLDQNYPIPQHILEFTWGELQKGTLNIDKSRNDEFRLTYHDSCNVARASRMGDEPGGQFEIPRNVIKAVTNNYYEMPEGTTKEQTLCCGGGGGLLTDDLMDIRKKGSSPRMHALKQVEDDHGVTHMVAICAICKTQFAKMMPEFGFERDSILSIHQLVSNALIMEGQVDEDDEDEDNDMDDVPAINGAPATGGSL